VGPRAWRPRCTPHKQTEAPNIFQKASGAQHGSETTQKADHRSLPRRIVSAAPSDRPRAYIQHCGSSPLRPEHNLNRRVRGVKRRGPTQLLATSPSAALARSSAPTARSRAFQLWERLACLTVTQC